jgi:folate-binding Fe-S cluster repair protein YgfZ
MPETTDDASATDLHWSSIIARGPEAESFLQGQLSQDLSTVSNGSWALLLAPDGIVLTSCFVSSAPDGYDLAVPRELGDAALARLRRFLLRTKCTLELVESEGGPIDTVEEQVEMGWPGAAEFARGLTPQSFGARFVAVTVSFTKGCFTGQELVGRLDARGSSVPWRMVRAAGPNEARVTEVLSSKGPVGVSGLTTWVDHGSLTGLGFAHRSLFGSVELEDATDVRVEEIA